MTRQEIAKLIKEKAQQALALLGKPDATAEEKAQAVLLGNEANALREQYDQMESADKLLGWASEVPDTVPAPPMPERREKQPADILIPGRFGYSRYRNLKSFRDEYPMEVGERKAAERAYRFGRFCAATLFNHENSQKWCREHGIELKAQSESVNTAGGFLVPDEFSSDIIDLREQYGVFRRRAGMSSMARDTKRVPRRTSGVTAYWVGEGQAITDSSKAWDMVNLVAKKLGAIVIYSSELSEDALINIGDDLAGEIAYAFALAEDNAGFLGDGTSTYGGCIGLSPAFQKTVTDAGGTWTTDAHKLYNPSIVNASGNLWSEFTIGNITEMMGRILRTKLSVNCAWYTHNIFYYSTMVRLWAAAGGVTGAEMTNGPGREYFLGYPVEFVQVMPIADSGSQIAAYFGDLGAAALFGDRREVTISLSDQYKWAEDQLAIKGTERIDIQVHGTGTANSSAASRVMAPISALVSNNA